MPRHHSKLLALCLALFGAAAVALWWFAADEGDGAAARAPATDSSVPTDAPAQRTTLEAPSSVERVERDPSHKRGLSVFLVGEARTSAGEPAQVDLVLIRGGDGVDGSLRTVEVRDITRERAKPRSYVNGRVARTADDGSFRVEITEHVSERLAAGAARLELWIKALRIGESPREFSVAIPLEREWREASAPVEVRADLVLRGSGRVHGRVLGREPLESDAWVALFEFNEGTLRRQPLANTRCDGESGAFEFLAEVDREVALVAWTEGSRPRTERLFVSDNSAPLELLLDRAERLTGVVKLGPDGVACGLDLELMVTGGMSCAVGEDVLTWTGDAFEWSRPYGQCDSSGRFEFTGLAPGRYRAHVKAPRGVRSSAIALDVVAPAQDLLLELPLARVELALFKDGAPAANSHVSVSEQRPRAITLDQVQTDAAGVAVLWLAEDSEVRVTRREDNHDVAANGVLVDNPGPGRSSTQRIDL